MIFESLYIRSFGKLSDRGIEFGSGVNIIEGANESGKSTICNFIKFIFYGLPSKTEEKLHFISWHTASAGGTLTFREGNNRYRIEREVVCATNSEGKNSFRERLAIIDADTNMPCFKGQSPGEVFFGVSASVFDSTAYIRQSANTKIGGHALGEEAENILFAGNESINTKKALDKLDSARVFLLHKNRKGGKITELEAKRTEIEEKLEIAKQASGDIIYLEGTHRQLSEKKEDAEHRLATVNAELEEFNRYTVKKACLRSKTEKVRLAEIEDKIDALRKDPAHGGMDISTDTYIASLEKKQSDLELATSRYSDAEENLKEADDKLAGMSEKLAIFERFGKAGGKTREELIKKTSDIRASVKKGQRTSILCFTGAVLFAVLAMVFMFALPDMPSYLAYIFLALVPVCIIPALICIGKNKKQNAELAEICTKFGCNTYAEFEELVKAATEDEAFMVFITGARDEASDKFNSSSERLENLSADILRTLRDHGFAFSENTSTSLAEAIKVCRETRTEIAKLETAASELRSRIKAIAEDLSAYSEDYLREALFADYNEEAMEAFNLAAKKRDRDFLTGSINTQTERLHEIDVELATLRTGTYKPTELAEEKAILDEQIETLTKKWAAYILAIESIENASGKLREGISPKIAKNASRLMNAMTEGKYGELGVDLDFALSFTEGGLTHDAAYLSAGTGDLAYMCLRIALIELLYKKSMPPFIFDESFVRMDDERLTRMMLLLHKYGQRNCQSILLSCHSRERKVSDAIGSYRHLSI